MLMKTHLRSTIKCLSINMTCFPFFSKPLQKLNESKVYAFIDIFLWSEINNNILKKSLINIQSADAGHH